MKNLLLIFIFLQFQFFVSQESKVDKEVREKIEDLQKKKIDTLIVFNEDCIGCYGIQKVVNYNCIAEEPKYIFWIKDGATFKQKFDGCTNFEEMKMKNQDFFKIAQKNSSKIRTENIKPPEHKVTKNKVIALIVDHYAYYDFEFYFGSKIFKKRIIDYYLTTKMIGKKEPNDNFNYNQKSILKRLLDMAKEEVY